MKKHTLLRRATAAALLSAAMALPAVVGLTAGTANARPDICNHLQTAYESSAYLAVAANDQGDFKAAKSHRADAVFYAKRYRSAGCS